MGSPLCSVPSASPSFKILLVSPSGIGGVQTFCASLAGGFKDMGHLPHVLFEGPARPQGPGPAMTPGVASSVFHYSPFDNLYRVLRRMAEFFETRAFDFVYPNTSAVAYRALGLLGPRRPVAIGGCTGNNAHDYACNTEFADYLDHIFCASAQSVDVLRRNLAGRGVGVTMIPHGIKPAEEAPRRSFAGELGVVFAGRFDPGKRLQDVVGVSRRLNAQGVPFNLTLAGDGPERPAVEKACLECGIGQKVRFPGFISREEVESLMRHAHVNLLLSESEGFGLSVLEGMKWGCVPIVTDTCGCIDVIREGVNGFIVGLGDTGKAAERVLQMDRDRALLARLSAACERTVREEYSSDKEVASHLEVLRLAQEHHQHNAARTIPWEYEPPSLINYPWVPNWLARNLRRLKHRFAAPLRSKAASL